MKTPPKHISRTLISFKDIILKLKIKLEDSNDSFSFKFHNEFEYGGNVYLNLNPSIHLSLELLDKEEKIYDPSRRMIITQMQMYQFIQFLKNLNENIHKKDTFMMRGNEIILYDDIRRKNTIMLQLPGRAIMGAPAIVYDENDVSYEGVALYINKTTNMAQLTVTEFEEFIYLFEKIDLFEYSQAILNYYVTYYRDALIESGIGVSKTQSRFKSFWDKPDENTVKSNFSKAEDDIMSGLPK